MLKLESRQAGRHAASRGALSSNVKSACRLASLVRFSAL